MITVKNLKKSFGELTAVDDVSFSINKGEVFGLLGPNGAGKTTTINIIVGLLKPDSGLVEIDGNSDPTKSSVRTRIGNAPQTLALYDMLSGRENLEFFGKLYGLSGSKLKERVDWALDFGRLTDRQKDRVGTYSGGMKRRLNMAGAVIHDPPVILFDEPTVGVDPQSRNMIFDSIEDLKAQGRTIVYTTHYMEEAERLCDEVAIIDHGKILDLGTVRDLTKQYGGPALIEAEYESLPDDISGLPGEFEGNTVRIETEKPMEDLAKLTRNGHTLRQLRIDQPDLETVFLNITGRSLRD
ncbi:MAG: ABC transporter ATP-binding protein [candidate division Zixibacteria bacterium]|nr:ABC transporter ATP-binding protein [candidate division Zixibacteria bacterium]